MFDSVLLGFLTSSLCVAFNFFEVSGALVGAASAAHGVDGIGFSPPGLYYQASLRFFHELLLS